MEPQQPQFNAGGVIVESPCSIDETFDETQKPQKNQRSRGWVFTLNMKEEHVPVEDLINTLNVSGADTWCFQLERASTGTLHYQGQLYFTSDRTWSCIKQLGIGSFQMMKNCRASIKYVSKSDATFVAGPWAKGIPISFRDTRSNFVMRPFQKDLFELKQDDRKITWVADTAGNMGKTTFAKHMVKNNNRTLYANGKANDIKCAIAKMVSEGRAPECVIFGFPRSKEAYVSYEAIEEVKDGLFFNGKYESGMVCFDSPKVIVLANFHPDKKQMTADRWNIRTINENYEFDDGLW